MDFLNLDEIAAEKRTITYKDKTYEVKTANVGAYIASLKISQKVAQGGLSEIEQFEESLKIIKPSIPDFPEEEIKAMTFNQLNTLIAFIQGATAEELMNGDPKEGEEEEAAKGKKAKKS